MSTTAPDPAPPQEPQAFAPPQEPQPASAPGEQPDTAQLRAQIEQDLRAELEQEYRQELASKLAAQQGKGKTPAEQPTVDLSEDDQEQRAERFKDWPSTESSDLPQPWDLKAQNLHKEELEPGKPNTVSPIVVSHNYPTLTSGSAHPAVHELGRILAALGFENTVSKGENPFGHVDQTIMGAVHAFRSVYHVAEDPTAFGGNTPIGRDLAEAHIGPWTWEAVLRAGEKLLEHA